MAPIIPDPFLSPFPPSISSEPWAYGLALFSDLFASCICLAVLLRYALDTRRARAAARLLNTPVENIQTPSHSLSGLHRRVICGLMLMVVFRSLPDALLLIAYREVTKPVLDALAVIDWWGDTLALAPCLYSLGILAWSKQAVDQVLANVSSEVLRRPTWADVRQAAGIGALAFIISVGLVIGKASA